MQWIRRLNSKDAWYGTGQKLSVNIHKLVDGYITVDHANNWLCVMDDGTLFNVVRYTRSYGPNVSTHAIAFKGIKGKDFIEGSNIKISVNIENWKEGYKVFFEEEIEHKVEELSF